MNTGSARDAQAMTLLGLPGAGNATGTVGDRIGRLAMAI
jgi:hypothetical protein